MKSFKLSTTFDIKYKIHLTENVFSVNNNLLLTGRNHASKNCLIIIDKNVYELYKLKINNYFTFKVNNFKIHLVKGGDKNKNIKQFLRIFDSLSEYPINRRNEPIIIIGGGVTTDIAAFATSCFRRGIPHIKVPTTLMGYVDASVGIKTGINFGENKNRMGSFYPPLTVILDKVFFNTLSKRELSNGIGEIIKIFVIKNKLLFNLLEKEADNLLKNNFILKNSQKILEHSIHDMISELEPNLYESDLERAVDFGHTFSLIFEMEKTTEIKHGEAVAMDVLFSSFLSYKRGLITKNDFCRIFHLIKSFDLPIHYNLYVPDKLWKSLQERMLHRDGEQRVPVPTSIGKSIFLNDITYQEIKHLCSEILKIEKFSDCY